MKGISLSQDRELPVRPRRRAFSDLLRQEIVSGRLEPGSWVRIGDLAERFGVSVSPVRDALLILAQEGLLEVHPGWGIRPNRVSANDAKDLFEIYSHVAGMMAEAATGVIEASDLDELEALIQSMGAEEDGKRLEELNWEFHRGIYRHGKSLHTTTVLRLLAKNVPVGYLGHLDEWRELNTSHHPAMLRALRNRDKVTMRLLAREHVRAGGELLLKHYYLL